MGGEAGGGEEHGSTVKVPVFAALQLARCARPTRPSQLQVAFSSHVSGVCGDDAQPYACATQRFARDFLLPQSAASSVPSCPECPPNTTLPYDHCKGHAEVT